MKMPKSVRVGPFRYEVAADHYMPEGDWGACDHAIRRIEIANRNRPKEEAVTLLHEIIHAVGSVYKAELEERQVDVLAHGLAQALGSIGTWPEKFE